MYLKTGAKKHNLFNETNIEEILLYVVA